MNASTTTKKQCVTCNKSGGVLICDGCQQIFCGKHVTEHRQELGGQLDVIMQENDLLQHEIERILDDHSLLHQIDQWEKDAINQIRDTAKNTRKNLKQALKKSKERLSKTCREMSSGLCSSREADDYSETDLTRWVKQMEELKLEITSPSSVKIIEDKKSTIHFITVESTDSTSSKQSSSLISLASSKIQEKFVDVIGHVTLENGGYVAKHTGSTSGYAFIRGHSLYSHGRHMIRFKIEQCKQPYYIFFGCISSQMTLKDTALRSAHTIGWFGHNQVYEHGRCSGNCKKHGYYSHFIKKKDILSITFDCDKKKIQLHHEGLKTRSTLSVNISEAPLPWQLLMVMFNKGDNVKILHNT